MMFRAQKQAINPGLQAAVARTNRRRDRQWAMKWALQAVGRDGRSAVEAAATLLAANMDDAVLIEEMIKNGVPWPEVLDAVKWARGWIDSA